MSVFVYIGQHVLVLKWCNMLDCGGQSTLAFMVVERDDPNRNSDTQLCSMGPP